jgi:hypothetical protein
LKNKNYNSQNVEQAYPGDLCQEGHSPPAIFSQGCVCLVLYEINGSLNQVTATPVPPLYRPLPLQNVENGCGEDCEFDHGNLTSGLDFGTNDLHTSNLGELGIESETQVNSGGYVGLAGFWFDPVQLHQRLQEVS